MDKNLIEKQLKQFLEEEFSNQGQELLNTTDLLNEWFVDSLGILNVILFLESNFNLDIAQEDIIAENFQNIETLANYIEAKLNGQA